MAGAPYEARFLFPCGGVALFGINAMNERKLVLRMLRLGELLDGTGADVWVAQAVPGKRKRRRAARELPPLPEREPDPRYSQVRYVPAPEWTIAHEMALTEEVA